MFESGSEGTGEEETLLSSLFFLYVVLFFSRRPFFFFSLSLSLSVSLSLSPPFLQLSFPFHFWSLTVSRCSWYYSWC